MKRNGEIDFLRFVFALFIVFLHYEYRPTLFCIGKMRIVLGCNGMWSVGFFFLVSGYFLVQSVERNRTIGCKISSFDFIKNKYFSWIKWFLVAVFFQAVLDIITHGIFCVIENIICSFPNILLLGVLGFANEELYGVGYNIGPAWYLSALLCCFAVLYPFICKQYESYRKTFAPILFFISIAMWLYCQKSGLIFWHIPYAFSMLILGTIMHETVNWINRLSFSLFGIVALRVIKVLCLLCFIFYMNYENTSSDVYYSLIFIMFFALTIALCEHGRNTIFDKDLFYFLGKISFPLFLMHIPIQNWIIYLLQKCKIPVSENIEMVMAYLGAIAVTIVLYMISKMDIVHKSMFTLKRLLLD